MQAMSEIPADDDLGPLQQVVQEIERGIAHLGWDRPTSLYALVPTADLLAAPDLPPDVAQQLQSSWDGSSHHLSAILQDSLTAESLEQALAQITWPETVSGAVLSTEMVTLPPAAEKDLPPDAPAAAEFAANHPDRAEVRFTVGVLRSGESWCMVRAKDYDEDASVGTGPNLTPGIIEALRIGFAGNFPRTGTSQT